LNQSVQSVHLEACCFGFAGIFGAGEGCSFGRALFTTAAASCFTKVTVDGAEEVSAESCCSDLTKVSVETGSDARAC